MLSMGGDLGEGIEKCPIVDDQRLGNLLSPLQSLQPNGFVFISPLGLSGLRIGPPAACAVGEVKLKTAGG
jgi:hypothetical protein